MNAVLAGELSAHPTNRWIEPGTDLINLGARQLRGATAHRAGLKCQRPTDMPPRPTTNDRTNQSFAYIVCAGQSAVPLTGSNRLTNQDDLSGIQLRVVVPLTRLASSTLNHVATVRPRRTEFKMVKPDARSVITPMADKHSLRDRSVREFEDDSSDATCSQPDLNHSVSVAVLRPSPLPAPMRWPFRRMQFDALFHCERISAGHRAVLPICARPVVELFAACLAYIHDLWHTEQFTPTVTAVLDGS